MMDEEPVVQIVDSVYALVRICSCQDEVHVDEIRAEPVDRTEPHLRKESDPGLDRMKLEVSDGAILGDEGIEEPDCLRARTLQKCPDRARSAGMRLVPVHEFLTAPWTDPESGLHRVLVG